jgi:hypothetical protein
MGAKGQSKKYSIVESITSTAIGFFISIIAQWIIFPIFNIYVSVEENICIAIFFTTVSIIRGYFVRRLFNFLSLR